MPRHEEMLPLGKPLTCFEWKTTDTIEQPQSHTELAALRGQ